MPPVTLPTKSDVIVKILKYFEALASEDTEARESTEYDNDTEAS